MTCEGGGIVWTFVREWWTQYFYISLVATTFSKKKCISRCYKSHLVTRSSVAGVDNVDVNQFLSCKRILAMSTVLAVPALVKHCLFSYFNHFNDFCGQ